ncbi:MAG: methylated-DNA--[protein]-cysteine S-methyltransferase [Gemmatimonadota bacterium]
MTPDPELRCRVDDTTLSDFLDGAMDDAAALSMAHHIADCPRCRQRAAAERAAEAVLRGLDAEDVVRWHRFKSPFGTMYAARTARGLSRISWQQPGVGAFEDYLSRRYPALPLVRDADALEPVQEEIERYFDGDLERFSVAVDLSDLRPFQKDVLEEAERIPFGAVIPYAELARRIARPRAARAVGNALGANPVAIVVPCHRIVASDGTLGGYTGGVEYKRRLLRVEGRRDLFSEVE